MVMPVNQRCPKCGNWFLGSDCLGSPCDSCLVNEHHTVKTKMTLIEELQAAIDSVHDSSFVADGEQRGLRIALEIVLRHLPAVVAREWGACANFAEGVLRRYADGSTGFAPVSNLPHSIRVLGGAATEEDERNPVTGSIPSRKPLQANQE